MGYDVSTLAQSSIPYRPRSRDDFEIAIICALSIESNAVEALFDEFWDHHDRHGYGYGKAAGDPNAYTTGRIGKHNVVLAYMPEMGAGTAASVAASFRSSFPGITLGLVVGICGGVPIIPVTEDEMILGDVVISTGLVQYDFGRQLPDRFVRKDTLRGGSGLPSNEIKGFLAKMQGLRARKTLKKDMSEYLSQLCKTDEFPTSRYLGKEKDRLFEPTYRHKHQSPDSCNVCSKCDSHDGEVCDASLELSCAALGCHDDRLVSRERLQTDEEGDTSWQPEIHFGLVATGNTVMKSGVHRDQIAARENVIAFEMEGGGVWDNFPTIVIKGVCDYADSHKNKIWQKHAAAVSATCAKAILQEWRPSTRQPQRQSEDVSGAKLFTVPLDTNKKYVERLDITRLIEDKLHIFDPGKRKSDRVALVGLGGSGKTELAVSFAERHRDQFTSVIWLDGTSSSSLQADTTRLASSLSKGGAVASIASMSFCREWLVEHNDWLLIVDNLDDEETIEVLRRDFLRAGMTGSVLVTTRNRSTGTYWDRIDVGDLGFKEARELLGKILHPDLPVGDPAGDALLADLGYLALAIDQAGSYIQEQALTCAEYRTILQAQRRRLLASPPSRLYHLSTRQSVWTTWEVSYAKVKQTSPGASALLDLFGFLDHENISVALLECGTRRQRHWSSNGEFCPVDKEDEWIPNHLVSALCDMPSLKETLAQLNKYSFFRWKAGKQSLAIHPLVHQWIQERASAPDNSHNTMSSCAIGLLTSCMEPQDLLVPFAPPAVKFLLGEERTLAMWPMRDYSALDLAAHARTCLKEVKNWENMPIRTQLQCLSLLQVLAYQDEALKRQIVLFLRLQASTLLSQKPPAQTTDEEKFYDLATIIWNIIITRPCECRKVDGYVRCVVCVGAYKLGAARHELHSSGDLPPLLSAGLIALFYVIELDTPSAVVAIPALGCSSSRRPKASRSSAEAYSLAMHCYFRGLIATMTGSSIYSTRSASLRYWTERYNDGVHVPAWADQREQSKTSYAQFEKLCGIQSEEYRRSVWVLTTQRLHDGKLEEVIERLKPLVEQTRQNPDTSWSHERCISRCVHTLIRLGRLEAARQMLVELGDAFSKQGKSLRSISQHPLLNPLADSSPDELSTKSPDGIDSFQTPGPPPKKWQLFVKTLTGKILTVAVDPTDLVRELFEAIHEREGTQAGDIRLIYGGKQLEPDRAIHEYGLSNNSTVHLVLRLLGG